MIIFKSKRYIIQWIVGIFLALVILYGSIQTYAASSTFVAKVASSTIYTFESTSIKSIYKNKNVSNSKCTFSSSNKKVATVDKLGNVKAVANGTTNITVKYGTKKAVVKLKVKTNDLYTTQKSFTFGMNYSNMDALKQNRVRLPIRDKGKLVDASVVTYTSSNKKIATVDKNGSIVTKSPGECVITVTKKKNKKMYLKVNVKVVKKDTSFKISPTSLPLNGFALNLSSYNSNTSAYYLLRSYFEYFEKVGGGTLTLKKGVYNLPTSLYIPSNVKLILEDGVVLNKTKKTGTSYVPYNSSMFLFCAPSKSNKKSAYYEYNGVHNVQIAGRGNVVFDMSGVKDGCVGLGFVFCHNSNISISGINFKNCRYGHFVELDASKDVSIENCTFSNQLQYTVNTNKECINLDTPDKNTGGFPFKWSSFDRTPNTNISILNCVFKDIQVAVGTHMYSATNDGQQLYHDGINIMGCNIDGSLKSPIRMLNWRNVNITSNIFTNSATTKNYKLFSIIGCDSVKIYNNYINNAYQLAQIMPCEKGGHPKTTLTPSEEECFMIANQNTIENVTKVYTRLYTDCDVDNKGCGEYFDYGVYQI